MHVLFVQPQFPGHFALLAHQLMTQRGWECTYLTSQSAEGYQVPYRVATYSVTPGQYSATRESPSSMEDNLAHMAAVLRGAKELKHHHGVEPDLVVGHTGWPSILYLKTLFSCPFIGYFDYLPPPFWSKDFVLRPDYPPGESERLNNAVSPAFTYLQMHLVDALWTPTRFQLSTLPSEFHPKAHVSFDCARLDLGHPRNAARPQEFLGHPLGPKTKVVTYVSRGFEAIRGFDIFMQVAARICRQLDDVKIFIAGEPRSIYGYDMNFITAASFKDHVLAAGDYDLSKIIFPGRLPPDDLARLYALSDLHIYLTVPYVLSWSCMHAMASGCTIVASATAPVQEMIEDGVHGLLAGFFDVEALTERSLAVLRDPEGHRHLGEAAARRIRESYGIDRCVEQFVDLAMRLARK